MKFVTALFLYYYIVALFWPIIGINALINALPQVPPACKG